METNNIKIPFWIKLKTLLFGKSFFKDYEITVSKYTRIFLHILNYTYIFGGWIFIAHYLDYFFKGVTSTLVSVIIILVINLLIIYLAPYNITPNKKAKRFRPKRSPTPTTA